MHHSKESIKSQTRMPMIHFTTTIKPTSLKAKPKKASKIQASMNYSILSNPNLKAKFTSDLADSNSTVASEART